jgi:hydroxypyruvate reductase
VPAHADPGAPLGALEVVAAGHPFPDTRSLRAGERTLAHLDGVGADDLVLFLASGGGSALLERPPDPSVSIDDMRALHELLVGSGAPILAMNVVRRHLSAVKGGRLAVRAAGARQWTLAISDVPGDRFEAIASGPSAPDPTTLADLAEVLDRFRLRERLPASLRALLHHGALAETPKPSHPAFRRATFRCVLRGEDAVQSALRHARARGFQCAAAGDLDDLDVPAAASRLLGLLEATRQARPDLPACIVAGGELSVPLPAQHGTGGRNQQFVLHCAQRIAGQPIAVLSAGTDGRDGSAKAAGAVADGTTLARAQALGLDAATHERRCDAHPFFVALGDVVEGRTGNNVRDLRLCVHAGPRAG